MRPAITAVVVVVGIGLMALALTRPGLPVAPAAAGKVSLPPLPPSGPSLKDLTDRAKTEGQVQVQWSGGLDDAWRQRFEAAFGRQFGFGVTLRIAAAGGQADLSIAPAADAAELARDKALASHEWNKLFGAPSQIVLFDAGSVAFAEQIVQPLYNTKRVSQQTPPIAWDILLDPKWKDRVGVPNDASVWADLSSSWGDERTTQFVQGLAAQQPVRGTPAELERKLEDGSIDLLAAAGGRLLRQGRERAAPIAPADVQPLLMQSWVASPLASATHPSGALLFAGFLITQEGQQLWQEYSGESSVAIPGTPNQALGQSRPYVLAGSDFLVHDGPERSAKYARILGY